MRSLLLLPALLLSTLVVGCATNNPAQVPEVDAQRLPALHLDLLNPRSVSLSVENSRPVNVQAGNAMAVAEVVQNSLRSALERGGVQIDPASKNQLHATILDCKHTETGTECVRILASLKTPRGTMEVTASSSHGVSREGGSFLPNFADLSKAYQSALQMVIEGLPEQLEKTQKR